MKDLSPLSVITPAYKIPAMVLTNSRRLYQWTRTMSLDRTWEKHILDCSMNECMDCKLPFGTLFFPLSLLSRSLVILTNVYHLHGWNIGIWMVKFSCNQSIQVRTSTGVFC